MTNTGIEFTDVEVEITREVQVPPHYYSMIREVGMLDKLLHDWILKSPQYMLGGLSPPGAYI